MVLKQWNYRRGGLMKCTYFRNLYRDGFLHLLELWTLRSQTLSRTSLPRDCGASDVTTYSMRRADDCHVTALLGPWYRGGSRERILPGRVTHSDQGDKIKIWMESVAIITCIDNTLCSRPSLPRTRGRHAPWLAGLGRPAPPALRRGLP